MQQWSEISFQLPYLFVYPLKREQLNAESVLDGEENLEPQLEYESWGEPEPLIPVYVLHEYEGVCADAIVAWKHSNCPELEKNFLKIWRIAIQHLKQMKFLVIENEIIFVNAPSKFSRRHNGQLIAEKLAIVAAEVFGGKTFRHQILKRSLILKRSRKFPDLFLTFLMRWNLGRENLGKNQREQKAKRIYVSQKSDLRGLKIILVDDVVTTGATLSGAVRAIEKAGGEVLCALALAGTRI
ncbi:MAG: phosphoribosyltransferase family protein [Arcanobacterium sp.]|nr:phosphoribosyltransferase family protein [Arcanobacterium sp.]